MKMIGYGMIVIGWIDLLYLVVWQTMTSTSAETEKAFIAGLLLIAVGFVFIAIPERNP